MATISYENIDLFYYHQIDIDFARFCSILNNGIVSKKAAEEENIKYYYRNYTHSSTRNEYISVSHFPRTIFRYNRIENELYDSSTNKITFVIDDIYAQKKQACFNRDQYTNERHVHYKIEQSQIKGILLREKDAKKKLSEILFNYKFTDQEYFENKVFTTIHFFIDVFGEFKNIDKIYYLIGRLREARICELPDYIIIEAISREIQNSINFALYKKLEIDNPTLLDVIAYFNNNKYPIYIMNRFDIELANCELATIDWRLERFKTTPKKTLAEIKHEKATAKKTLKLLKKMSLYGLDIYYGYSSGPLSEEDSKIVEEVKQLSLKK